MKKRLENVKRLAEEKRLAATAASKEISPLNQANPHLLLLFQAAKDIKNEEVDILETLASIRPATVTSPPEVEAPPPLSSLDVAEESSTHFTTSTPSASANPSIPVETAVSTGMLSPESPLSKPKAGKTPGAAQIASPEILEELEELRYNNESAANHQKFLRVQLDERTEKMEVHFLDLN